MKPEYINALKAGVKTAMFTFVTGIIAVITTLASALQDAVLKGNPPDLEFLPGVLWSLLGALGIGIVNASVRFVQAAGIPLFTQVFDKVFGAIPVYVPQNTGSAIKSAGEQIVPGPADTDHITDRGEITFTDVILVLILVGVGMCVAKLY